MRDGHSRQHRALRFGLARQTVVITLILLPLFLWGCAGKSKKEVAEPKLPSAEKQQPAKQTGISVALPPSAYSAVFNSAEQSLAKFDWMQADVALQELPETGLSQNDRVYVAYLQARISFIRGDQKQALAQIERVNTTATDPALRYRILSFKHYMLDIQGDTLASAQLGDQILRTAPGDTVAAWKRSVWRNLEATDTAQLSAALSGASDAQWRGWLDLALISRDPTSSLPAQLGRWRSANPEHPAAKPLPGAMDYLPAQGTRAGKVAILLPLSGKLAPAGKAVLNGFLAAYYEDSSTGGTAPELLVMDLDTYPSASAAYEEAVRQSATMIVGPLSKEGLADLATLLERPVPILALNRIDQVLPASGSALVQMSLSPEDEATSMADLAFGAGARRALVLSPGGDWGKKMEAALLERWTALGGSVASLATYEHYDNYSSTVESALSLDASAQRARELRTMLGTNIEFTPRRREDIDVIFLLSRTAAEARTMKPLLAFHYAGDLPVWAPSSIYNGVPDERNQDLSGIHMVETPWLLGANPGLRVTLAAGDAGGDGYTQLNALGADAFLVQSGFGRLQGGADAIFRGNTGLLTMDPNLIIRRDLSAATFDGSDLKPQ